jgi:hypothetical protein
MLERYRSLLSEDDPDPYRRRHLVQTAAQISTAGSRSAWSRSPAPAT